MIARKTTGQTVSKKYGYVATNLRIRKTGPGCVTCVFSAPIGSGTIKTVCNQICNEEQALTLIKSFTEKRPFSQADSYDSNEYPIWIQQRNGVYMLKHFLPKAFDPTDREVKVIKNLSAPDLLELLRKLLTGNNYILR